MQRRVFCKLAAAAATSALLPIASRAFAPSMAPALPLLGKIKPRSSHEISSSSWSVGGETLDRDFAVYANYKSYLGPLGTKGLRLQAGWAKCEARRGEYDWKWLDDTVNDALAQGVQPWLQLSYGNPIYPGGGDASSGSGFPSSTEAMAAWNRWVQATVEHYKSRVHEWEIWNEPDLADNGTTTVAAYVDLYIRTASIIRKIQPKGKSRIYALALCYKVEYAGNFLDGMAAKNMLDLVDAITIHSYPNNPDDTRNIDQIRAKISSLGQSIPLRQGETGSPSKFQDSLALSGMPWTETLQAKWDLRRMLAHHGKDVPFSLFSMMDMHYVRGGKLHMNYKGLLAAQQDPNDLTVAYAKPSYYAAQNVFSIFDDSWGRETNFKLKTNADTSVSAFAYRSKDTHAPLISLWFDGSVPVESNATTALNLEPSDLIFEEPVYVDLLTGNVFALPRSGRGGTLKQIAVYDAPVLIAERKALHLKATKG